MRYVTATSGAGFMFLLFLVGSYLVMAILPDAYQGTIAVRSGSMYYKISPVVLTGIILGMTAGWLAFRRALRRAAI